MQARVDRADLDRDPCHCDDLRVMRDASLMVLCTLLVPAIVAAAEHADVIDLSQQFQVIDNFVASDCWTMQRVGGWSDASKNRIADLLFSTDRGIGLSLWRFNIGGGINHASINNPWRTA